MKIASESCNYPVDYYCYFVGYIIAKRKSKIVKNSADFFVYTPSNALFYHNNVLSYRNRRRDDSRSSGRRRGKERDRRRVTSSERDRQKKKDRNRQRSEERRRKEKERESESLRKKEERKREKEKERREREKEEVGYFIVCLLWVNSKNARRRCAHFLGHLVVDYLIFESRLLKYAIVHWVSIII